MTTIYLDLETYSEQPISAGVYRYAEAAEVMLFAWAIDDGPVSVWDATAGIPMPETLERAWSDPQVLVIAHNAQFDRVVLDHAPGWDWGCPHLRRWRCTMAQALAHGLPGGLDALGQIFGLAENEQKQKQGRQLVNRFCRPRSRTLAGPQGDLLRQGATSYRATSATHPQEWAQFVDYAAGDVVALRAIHRKLPDWNFTDGELELWRLDQTINDRGFMVDLELARNAIRAVDAAQAELAARTTELTGAQVGSATQRDQLLQFILDEHGIDLPDMRASTLERRLQDENLSAPLRELIGIRLLASGTATAKYRRLLEATSRDGRLRGTLQFCGAARTGRWAGRQFQPQNLSRASLPAAAITDGIAALKAGIEDLLYV